jgi:hypothetical protein
MFIPDEWVLFLGAAAIFTIYRATVALFQFGEFLAQAWRARGAIVTLPEALQIKVVIGVVALAFIVLLLCILLVITIVTSGVSL